MDYTYQSSAVACGIVTGPAQHTETSRLNIYSQMNSGKSANSIHGTSCGQGAASIGGYSLTGQQNRSIGQSAHGQDSTTFTGQPLFSSNSRPSHNMSTAHNMSGHYTSGYHTSSHNMSGHQTSGHHTSGHHTSGHQTSGHQTSGHHTSGHQTSRHHTAGHDLSGRDLSGHNSSGRDLSGHNSSGHDASGSSHGNQTNGSSYFPGSRVVTGEETVIGVNTIEGEDRVLSERIVEHEIKVPKKIIVEEVIEKIIVIPETITREEYIDEIQKITETIIEIAKPIIQEKIIEVQEIEYRDKIVERVEKIQQEKIREVPKIEYQERIVEVPKYITRQKIVEVPEIEYRDVVVEKIIEVPEYREHVVIREVPTDQYVDMPVPEYVDVEEPYEVGRNIPVPVEAVTTFEYQLVQFRPRVHTVQYPLYVPRFVEVPVPAELFDPESIAHLQAENAKLQNLSSAQAVSLCEVENMATEFRRNDVTAAASNMDIQAALAQAWQSNSIQVSTKVVSSGNFHGRSSLPYASGSTESNAPSRSEHRKSISSHARKSR